MREILMYIVGLILMSITLKRGGVSDIEIGVMLILGVLVSILYKLIEIKNYLKNGRTKRS